MIDCGFLVGHLDRFPGKFDLRVADKECVKVGHGRWKLLNTWTEEKKFLNLILLTFNG